MDTILNLLSDFGDWAWNVLKGVWSYMSGNKLAAMQDFHTAGGYLNDFIATFRKAFRWMSAIKHTKIWLELQKWYGRYKQWIAWYQKHVLGPIQKVQRILSDVYQIVFGPLIAFGQAVQGVASVIQVFNSKLAEKIDETVWKVEATLTGPLNAVIAKVSTIEGWFYSILTASGLFDFNTLFASLAWSVADLRTLARPGGTSKLVMVTVPRGVSAKQACASLHQYLATGEGPLKPGVAKRLQALSEYTVLCQKKG